MWRWWRDNDGFEADFVLQVINCFLELGVFAFEGGVGQVVHDNVRVNPVAFDQPLAFRTVNANLGGGSDAFIDEPIARAEPNLTAPGARANDFAKTETLETFGEGLAIGTGEFIAEHDQMAAEGILHVPGRIANAGLPIKPGLAHQLFQNP